MCQFIRQSIKKPWTFIKSRKIDSWNREEKAHLSDDGVIGGGDFVEDSIISFQRPLTSCGDSVISFVIILNCSCTIPNEEDKRNGNKNAEIGVGSAIVATSD